MPDPADEPRPITAAPPPPAPLAPPAASPAPRRVAFELACAIIVGSGVALTLHLLTTSRAEPVRWGFELLGGTLVCLAVYGMTRWWWARPTREMRHLIDHIRAGEAPIEELNRIGRGARVLVPAVQALLCDLREQRRELATLNDEIRQRVAHRTDALERTIGTLRHHATRDGLTGLFNRRFLDTFLPQVIQRCTERGLDVTLLMADLDHFKLLNDTLGHAAGDDLLRSMGQLIRSTIRGEDAAFRVGGDEFVIVMPVCGPAQGRALAERLSSLVDALGRTYKLPKRPRMSFGVACLTETPGASPTELMSRADQALYDCKRARRAEHTAVPGGAAEPLQAGGSSLQCPAQ